VLVALSAAILLSVKLLQRDDAPAFGALGRGAH